MHHRLSDIVNGLAQTLALDLFARLEVILRSAFDVEQQDVGRTGTQIGQPLDPRVRQVPCSECAGLCRQEVAFHNVV